MSGNCSFSSCLPRKRRTQHLRVTRIAMILTCGWGQKIRKAQVQVETFCQLYFSRLKPPTPSVLENLDVPWRFVEVPPPAFLSQARHALYVCSCKDLWKIFQRFGSWINLTATCCRKTVFIWLHTKILRLSQEVEEVPGQMNGSNWKMLQILILMTI